MLLFVPAARRELYALASRIDCRARRGRALVLRCRESARAYVARAATPAVIASAFTLQPRSRCSVRSRRIAYLHGATAAVEPYLERVAGLIGVQGEASSGLAASPIPFDGVMTGRFRTAVRA